MNGQPTQTVDIEAHFEGFPEARRLFDALARLISRTGPVTVRVTKSQVSFGDERAFAWAWVPGRYQPQASAPLVVSVRLAGRSRSRRWKEIVEPRPGQFMHHLELRSESDLDAQVQRWITEAREAAGGRRASPPTQ